MQASQHALTESDDPAPAQICYSLPQVECRCQLLQGVYTGATYSCELFHSILTQWHSRLV